jgi:hypothetical protein
VRTLSPGYAGAEAQGIYTTAGDASISCGTITTIRQRLSAALAQPTAEALLAARQQPVAYVDETGAPTGNLISNKPPQT